MINVHAYGSLKIATEFVRAAPTMWQHSSVIPREVRLIVLHSAECGESGTAAEALAGWGKSTNRPKASWHFAVDNNSVTQSVELDNISWHAGIVNSYSIGIEMAGRAAQTAAQWSDQYSLAMLENTARLLAVISGQYDLPLDFVDSDLSKARGVTTHAAVTKCFCVKGGHSDPGPNFPIELVLAKARAYQLEAVT